MRVRVQQPPRRAGRRPSPARGRRPEAREDREGLDPRHARMLDLQESLGNRGVARALARQAAPEAAEARATLRRGARGPSVEELQRSLNERGARPELVPDGIFGPRTRRAVIALQAAAGLRSDGVVGSDTWAAIDAGARIPEEAAPATAPPARREDRAAEEEGEGQERAVERESGGEGAASPEAASSPNAELAARIRAQLRGGGIAVGIYGAAEIGAHGEFRRQADQWAADHGAIGLRRGEVVEGAAMMIGESAAALLAALALAIEDLLASNPDPAGGDVSGLTVKTLALFTHGTRRSLQIAPGGAWLGRNARRFQEWVESLVPYLAPSPQVVLYACSTAGRPPGGVPFAEALQATLKAGLDERYGEDADVNPVVWGHLDPGHTTANSRLLRFDGSPESPGGESLYGDFSERFEELALERANAERPTDRSALEALRDPGRTAMRRVFHARGRTGAKDPVNVLIREIPTIGMDRLWEDISTDRTPDYSDLGMEPDATARLVQGAGELRGRFRRELERLVAQLTAER